MPEIRKTTLTRNEILVAIERAARPDDFKKKEGAKTAAVCPFCPGNEEMTPRPELLRYDSENGGWSLRVVPNKFPALRIEGDSKYLISPMQSATILNAHGAHEVIVETPVHQTDYSQMTAEEIQMVLYSIVIRTEDLYRDPAIQFILAFKNFGSEAGASLTHEHVQLIGLPHIPQKIRHRLNRLEEYLIDHGHSVFQIVIERAEEDGRIIDRNEHFISLVPYEAKFPFEVWIMPLEFTANIMNSRHHFPKLAQIISQTFKRFATFFSGLPPFNYFIDEAPPPITRNCEKFYCWRFRICPRLTKIAGFELASGYYINPVSPKESAQLLKKSSI